MLLYDEKVGSLCAVKVSSSMKQPANSFIEGLKKAIASDGTDITEISSVIHGTTIVSNSLLEGKTAPVGMLFTEGFRDILEIGRQSRPELYNLMVDRHLPLASREWVLEIEERIGPEGKIILPLDQRKALRKIKFLAKQGIDCLAVVLLFSFRNPDHEKRLKKIACTFFPEQFVFLSSEVSPEFREFERASTTVIAAAVAPRVVSYLGEIDKNLKDSGWKNGSLTIMHSGGGTLEPEEAIRRPHTMVESGPAAGIIATGHLAKILGIDKTIAFDMGGTTAKTGLVLDGKPQYTTEYEVGSEIHHGGHTRGSGYPLRFPMVDVAECGAGAGSIARIDRGGHLKLGPQSAGADPGPACYGKGGKLPTVTDAYVVLGYLATDSFLGGEMLLQYKLAANAITEHISKKMRIPLEEAAQGILNIANSNILRILSIVSVARGYDPRDFTLVAYGGAGALHATALAEEMSIRRVVVPPFPGLFSALGLLYADITTDFVETLMVMFEMGSLKFINAVLSRLKKKAELRLKRTGTRFKEHCLQFSVDLRYLRQNYELNVHLPGANLSSGDMETIQACFHEAHASAYGHSTRGEAIQLVNVRVLAVKITAKPELKPINEASKPVKKTLKGMRSIWLQKGDISSNTVVQRQCGVYERSFLQAGHTIKGPAIIQEKEATTLVRPGWHVCVDRIGNLLMEYKD